MFREAERGLDRCMIAESSLPQFMKVLASAGRQTSRGEDVIEAPTYFSIATSKDPTGVFSAVPVKQAVDVRQVMLGETR